MPRLSRWFIRAALLYLAVGFTFGALLLGNKGYPFAPWLWRLLPSHIEFMVIGWTMQLILGVGFWILPRFRGERGRMAPAWTAFALLNAGVLLAALAPLLGGSSWLVTVGRAAEAGAAASFAIHAWPRIKAAGA